MTHLLRPGFWAARLQGRAGMLLAFLPLVLMVASDYKVRVRAIDQAVGGAADPLVLVELGVYGVVGVFLYLTLPRARPLRVVSMPTLAAGLWFGMLALSALYSPYLSLSLARVVQLGVWLLLTLALARVAGRAGLHRLAHGFVLLVAASVVLGKAHPFPPLRLQAGRFTWLYVHPVVSGIYLGVAAVVAMAYLFGHAVARPGPRWPRTVYLLLFLLLFYGLVATKTRGAALAAVAAIFLMMFLLVRRRRRRDLIVFSILGAGGAALALSSVLLDFLARGESTSQLATLNSRTELWTLAWDQVQLQPVFGHGLAASRGLFLDEIGLGGGHNVIVNIMVDQGFLGLFFFILLIASLAFALRGLVPVAAVRMDVALLSGVLLFLVADGMTTEYMGAPDNVASGWLLLVVTWVYTLHLLVRGSADRRDPSGRRGSSGGGGGGGGAPAPQEPTGPGGVRAEREAGDGRPSEREPMPVGPRGGAMVPGQASPRPSAPRPAWPEPDEPLLVPRHGRGPVAGEFPADVRGTVPGQEALSEGPPGEAPSSEPRVEPAPRTEAPLRAEPVPSAERTTRAEPVPPAEPMWAQAPGGPPMLRAEAPPQAEPAPRAEPARVEPTTRRGRAARFAGRSKGRPVAESALAWLDQEPAPLPPARPAAQAPRPPAAPTGPAAPWQEPPVVVPDAPAPAPGAAVVDPSLHDELLGGTLSAGDPRQVGPQQRRDRSRRRR